MFVGMGIFCYVAMASTCNYVVYYDFVVGTTQVCFSSNFILQIIV